MFPCQLPPVHWSWHLRPRGRNCARGSVRDATRRKAAKFPAAIDKSKRPTSDVHRRPPIEQSLSELTCLLTAWADFMPSIKNATTLKRLWKMFGLETKHWLRFGAFSSNSFRWRKMQVSHASTQPWRPDLLHSPSVSVYVGSKNRTGLFNVYIWWAQFSDSSSCLP
jgi:hypothetical protein